MAGHMVESALNEAVVNETVSPATEAARAVVRVARMLEHACRELTLPQYRLLVMVASGDQRASKLAGRLALSKPTVTAVVDGLVERGYLTRSEACGDRRAVDLSLTESGHRALAVTDAAMAERLGRVLDLCDDPAHAEAGLLQLSDAVDRVVAEKMAEKVAEKMADTGK
jgi:DNA-binding MarR family transcriptional regulator